MKIIQIIAFFLVIGLNNYAVAQSNNALSLLAQVQHLQKEHASDKLEGVADKKDKKAKKAQKARAKQRLKELSKIRKSMISELKLSQWPNKATFKTKKSVPGVLLTPKVCQFINGEVTSERACKKTKLKCVAPKGKRLCINTLDK